LIAGQGLLGRPLLKLDSVAASPNSLVNESFGDIHGSIVIDAYFRYDVNGFTVSYDVAANSNSGFFHGFSPRPLPTLL
jgi:hypothetical protein